MGTHAKSVTDRLTDLRKLAGQQKALAVAMMGLGFNMADIAKATETPLDALRETRHGHALTVKAVKDNPNEARAFLLQVQQDAAMCRGFALSHNPSTPPRELRNIVSTAAILAKGQGTAKGAKGANPPIPKPTSTPVRPS